MGGTAYVVGGYTGSRWLDTIVAWRPGTAARVVAHLPSPVRYAAVTAVDGEVVIAGGSLPDGSASRAVLAYLPTSGRVIRLGQLPAPTTHGAAATLGHVAYLVGGRGADTNTPTARIVAIDPARHRVRVAGHLSAPRSDLAAVSLGDRIVLAGGRGASGTEAALSELTRVDDHCHGRAAARASGHEPRQRLRLRRREHADRRARLARPLIYVPNSQSDTVDVIDPRTYRVVEHFARRRAPAARRPRLGPEDAVRDERPRQQPDADRSAHGQARTPIPVDDPYNMYFTPDGRYAIVVAERLHRLDFRDPHTFAPAPLAPGAVRWRRPHRLLRRRPLPDRELRVLRPAGQGRRRAGAGGRRARPARRQARCRRT